MLPRRTLRASKKRPYEYDERPDWLLQMEDILETLNEGVMILDDCRNILFINSCLERMFGFPASEVVGRNGTSFYTEEEPK